MKPLPYGVYRNSLKPEPTRRPYCVERLSFLLRRIPTVGSPENLERSYTLSLKRKSQTYCKFFSFFFPHVFFPFQFEEDDTIHYFILFSFNYSLNAFKSWISDIWRYLGRPFPSSLYSCNSCHMSTFYR